MPSIKVGNINMYYEVHGDGEPLVLIQGLSLDSSAWVNQVSVFSQRYKVIVFDNRGVGQSDSPDLPYTTEMMADDTVGLLRVLNIKNAHVLGFSMGGMIAQQIALKYPELVKSLILVTTGAKFPARAKYLTKLWLKMLEEQVSTETRLQEICLWVFTDEFFEDEARVTAAVNLGLNNPHPQQNYGFAGQVAALLQHDTRDKIDRILVPTLVLIGKDEIFISLKFSEELATHIPNSELVVLEQGSHNYWLEFPEPFNQTVMQFMAKLTASK
ncbi:alpha/beta hydrolase [Chroococcidiopsis sp. CCALA 051]|uniref:alpha/beta fold hydrolase n=1 Tax=Chroococcidiopsis sp. CCALA 051 TaxID=869949 RepID=UPI000D0DD537|nr:alpha/beta hydrolase [Chroococcidiopsis sp. CCALA 051]MBE9014737.1 alpha/beta fold hydrolase [Chroococcidiopsidales cyanobacterium LEGE 13417]PSM47687.1 alpha/beta hydrolase [Chroococcidiopsis sp. CCALA 051]